LRVQLRRVQTALAGLARNEQMAARYAEQSERRAFVRGRIAQFLEGLVAAEPNRVAYLQLRESELSREVGRLDEALDPDAVASEVATRLSFVNETLTDLARELQLEHSEHQVRIDLPNLTLVADTRERGAIPLRRIGSASNQVGYHVTAHLALHKWFVEERRPVPGFLILDQPEQAYYPDDIPESVRDPSILLKESDEARVRGLYGLINRIVTDLGGRFQVIVVGHANLTDLEWFEDARVEDWKTDGAGLVPMDWLRPQPASAREHD